jgi:hypothetical protein
VPRRVDAAAAAAYVAITVALTYPLVRTIGSVFPHDAGDPALNTWLLWWSTQKAPLTQAWWNAPMFHPMRDAMALSELLIGLLPITAPVQWITGNPLAAYNVAFLLSFPLCGAAAYALAFELTSRRDAAFLAGLAFAFGPYRMNELSHVQMLSYYWAPVSLLGLHRYLRTRHTVWLAVFAGSWLMQGLSNGYALFHLSVLVVLWVVWFVRDGRTIGAIGSAWALAMLPLIAPLLKYREVHARLHLARDINEIERFSPDIASVFSAPPDVRLWGPYLRSSHFETAIFPGITVALILLVAAIVAVRHRRREDTPWTRDRILLAGLAIVLAAVAASVPIVGPWSVGRVATVGSFHKPFSIAVAAAVLLLARSPWWRRAWRERSAPVFYGAATVALYVLSFGPSPVLLGRPVLYEAPYAWLMRLPGFDALRVPARFAMLALLGQAIVIALAFARWRLAADSRRLAVGALLGVGLLADGWIRLPIVPAFGRAPAWSAASVASVVELPPGEAIVDFPAIYRSMFHRQPLVNGFSGYAPPHYLPLAYAIEHGQFEALEEIAVDGPLGVGIDRSVPWYQSMEMWASRLPSATRVRLDDGWTTFVVSGRSRPALQLGPLLLPVAVQVNRHPENVGRLTDGQVETAWSPGAVQEGGEEVLVDLGSVQNVGAVVLEMGSYSFGFPRELAIEVSTDGRQWQTVWRGETSVRTVRAALIDPGTVPVTFELGATSGRFVRLRQMGKDPVVPWWIAELKIYEFS